MERKFLFVIISLVSVVAALGIFLLVYGQGEGDAVSVSEAKRPDAQPVRVIDNGAEDADTAREPVAPENVPALDPDAMPESYKKALGLIRGRIVESDGPPVPEIRVEFFSISALEILRDGASFMGDDPPKFEFKTGATETAEDGTFSFEAVYPRAIHMLGIDPQGSRSTTRFVDNVPGPGETVDLGDIVLAPYAVLFGVVKDEQGDPVEGARVRTTQLPPVVFTSGLQDFREKCSFLVRFGPEERVFDAPQALMQFYRMVPFPTTQTGADGSFRMEGVPLGLQTLVVDKPGLVTERVGPVSTALGGEKDLGEIEMDSGVILAGKVLEHDGKPAKGIEVRIGPIHGISEFIVLQPPLFTDDQGKFAFKGAAPLSTFAVARRYSEDPWVFEGPFHPGQEKPVLRLPPAYDLRVIALKEDNSPAKGARLKLREKRPFDNMFFMHTPTAPKERLSYPEDGVIEVKGLSPGKFELLLAAPGCGMKRAEVSVLAEPVVKEVVLEPAYEAKVRVLAEKDGSPVEWAGVNATLGEGSWWLNPMKMSKGRTGPEGLAVLKNLTAGEYKVSVSHPGFAVTDGKLEVPTGDETVIFVKRGGIIEGVVRRGGSAFEAPYMVSLNIQEFKSGPEALTPRFTATDLEGRFRATNLNPGKWQVHVLKRLLDEDPLGLGEVLRMGPLMSSETEVWSGETSYIEIDLESGSAGPGAEVSGRVLVNGKPAVGARLVIRTKKRIEATVNAGGRYSLGKVPVGKHSLRIAELPGTPMSGFNFNIRRRVEVMENLPLYEDFDLFTGAIAGRVIYDSDGTLVRGVRVRAEIEGDDAPYTVTMHTVTGLDGSFLFEGLPMGSYTVKADQGGFGCMPAFGVKVFTGGGGGLVTLVMIDPVVVAGWVKLPDAVKNARWIGLVVKSADSGDKEDKGGRGGTEWVALDKETGEFETTKLIPGSYTANLFSGAGQKYKPMEFDVPPGGLANLVLTPEPDEKKPKQGGK